MTFAERPVTTSATATARLPYAAALGALLLAGCTSGSPAPPVASSTAAASVSTSSSAPVTPSSAVTSTTPPSPTTTVDPVLARIPKAARPETIQGASAFGRYYFESLSNALKAGDPESLEELSDPNCTTCRDLYDVVAELQRKNLRHDGQTLSVTLSSATVFNAKERQVLVRLDQHSVPVIDAKGKRRETTKAGTGAFVMVLRYSDHWVVTDLGRPA